MANGRQPVMLTINSGDIRESLNTFGYVSPPLASANKRLPGFLAGHD